MSYNILICEDDDLLKLTIKDILTRNDYEIYTAGDAEAALKICNRVQVDIIVIDYLLPDMNGIDSVYHIRKILPNCLIIIITAFATVDIAVDAMKKGVDDVITKPFSAEKIVMTVAKCLAQRDIRFKGREVDRNAIYSALSNNIRRSIILLLSRRSNLRFTDIFEVLNIEDHTKLNFHLQVLKRSDIIFQDDKRCYYLSNEVKEFINRNIRDSL